ncbi:MAG: hypothetical protein Q8L14_34340 [Myxococcales bacterium]|nr:hypothetical protein [Myxococcales bacterium]
MSDCTACGVLPPSGLKSLWGLSDPDLRLCAVCGDWFTWTSAAPNAELTRIARTTALVMEELLSGTVRPREAVEQAVALVEPTLFAALIDHLKDDALAPLLEHFVAWLPTASGPLATALGQRLATAVRSPRFNAALGTLLGAAPSSPRSLHLLGMGLEASKGPGQRPATPLSADEVADFWALGVSLEANLVPDPEWARAVAESRVQEVSSYSSMGTAETGWVRCSSATTRKSECAVVPPGATAEHTSFSDMADDRDTIAVCWQPFWNTQVAVALGHVKGSLKRYVLAECARQLGALERSWPHEGEHEDTRQRLVGWLDDVTLTSEELEGELAAVKQVSLVHLVRGVRARWLKHDCNAAVAAVLMSAERGKRDFWGHGNTELEAAVRMELLRFIVRLVRQ